MLSIRGIKKKKVYFFSLLFFITLIFITSSCKKKNSEEDKLYSKKICDQKVAPFYYSNTTYEGKQELKKLCNCIWNKFPEGSWQRKINIKLYDGEDIGWKIKSFSSLFELNYKQCISQLNINE